IQAKENVSKLPNAALRFYPKTELVRPEDRPLLEGLATQTDKNRQDTEPTPSAREKAAANRRRNHRHIWVRDGDFLKAVEVVTGISDGKYTELLSDTLPLGSSVVTG